jgi:hypothetical protein
MSKLIRQTTASFLFLGTAAAADPWKDESGQGRHGGDYREYRGDRDRSDRHRDNRRDRWSYGIPRGQLPPPGLCRLWLPDRPAGHQPPPMSCQRARRIAYHHGGEVIRGRRDR